MYLSSYGATDAFRFDLGLIFVNGDFVAGLGHLIHFHLLIDLLLSDLFLFVISRDEES